jgi:hypothetical protein
MFLITQFANLNQVIEILKWDIKFQQFLVEGWKTTFVELFYIVYIAIHDIQFMELSIGNI